MAPVWQGSLSSYSKVNFIYPGNRYAISLVLSACSCFGQKSSCMGEWRTLLSCAVFGPDFHSKNWTSTCFFVFLCVIRIVAKRLPSLRKKRHTGLCTDCHGLDDTWNYNMVKQSAEYSPCAQTLALVFSYSFARIFVN